MSLRRLLDALDRVDPPVSADEIADAIWLARERRRGALGADRGEASRRGAAIPSGAVADAGEPPARGADSAAEAAPEMAASTRGGAPGGRSTRPAQEHAGLYVPRRPGPDPEPGGLLMRAPTARALPGGMAIARSLRPLRRRVESPAEFVLDEEATVDQIAETSVWAPTLRPALERWLDLALVVDTSGSMVVWRRSVAELRTIL